MSHRRRQDDKLSKLASDVCCHPDCLAPPSPDLATQTPLCDRHIFDVYRTVSKQMGIVKAEEQRNALLPMESECVDGPCPSCGHSGYLLRSVDDQIRCCNGACTLSVREPAFHTMRETALFLRAEGESVVYYMRARDRIKIGWTTNLQKRWRAITNAEELIGFEFGDRRVELLRHHQFGVWRTRGEWFEYVEPIRKHVNEVTSFAA